MTVNIKKTNTKYYFAFSAYHVCVARMETRLYLVVFLGTQVLKIFHKSSKKNDWNIEKIYILVASEKMSLPLETNEFFSHRNVGKLALLCFNCKKEDPKF